MNPKFPIYVVSKGRWESRQTVKSLEKRKIPFSIVIEPQEFEQYSQVVDPKKILMLPFSNLGQGSIPARNWIWEHSLSKGAKKHWILDDNLKHFYRRMKGHRQYTTSGTTFVVIEDFCDRYENIALAGMQYRGFVPDTCDYKPVAFNTRIYSCILIQNDIPYRWRGRYNEDTDLSLRVLKDGWCTALFYAFITGKTVTMSLKGGNTDELYKGDGRLKMAQSLQRQHPDVVRIIKRWNRWQHLVNYKPFKGNRLKKKENVNIKSGIDNYGMKLERVQ